MSVSSLLRGIFPFLLNPMAPGNMKSEFVGLQRNKIVSKSALSRKALARIGENVSELSSPTGPVNMAMEGLGGAGAPRPPTDATVALSTTGPRAQAGEGDRSRPATKNPGLLAADPDGGDTLILDEGKFVEKHEVEHLKALSMLHLDVIEQQQNELQRREKELQKVRAQNDTLKARLERIQRRTVLAQKHQEPLLNHVYIPSSESTLSCKRRSSLELSTPVKRQQTEKDATPSKSPSPSSPASTPVGTPTTTPTRRKQLRCKAKDRAARRRERLTPTKEDRPERSRRKDDRSSLRREEQRTPRREGLGSKVKEERRNGGEGERGGIKPEQYLKTEVIYPCLSDLRVTDPDPALPEGETVVQVPSWRVNVLSSSTSTDSMEDIEEMTYERRHQKYEIAEQKRKRWDIQRLRELREHERLEQKMLRREYGNWDDVLKTFYPEPSDACQLQVSETIPLVAFGVQVPVAKDIEFELPWYDVNERDKEESRRQTRSRTSRR